MTPPDIEPTIAAPRKRKPSSARIPEPPDAQDSTARAIGQLEGRVLSIEDRLDRSDAATTARLTTIEKKLDNIAAALSRRMGGLQLAHWIASGTLAAIGIAVSHLWPGKS
jgi:hypothetical protein